MGNISSSPPTHHAPKVAIHIWRFSKKHPKIPKKTNWIRTFLSAARHFYDANLKGRASTRTAKIIISVPIFFQFVRGGAGNGVSTVVCLLGLSSFYLGNKPRFPINIPSLGDVINWFRACRVFWVKRCSFVWITAPKPPSILS